MPSMVGLEELPDIPDTKLTEAAADQRRALAHLLTLIQKLKFLDRQVIVSYLEGMDGVSIADITGLSAANVATKIHRIKGIPARWFHEGGRDDA